MTVLKERVRELWPAYLPVDSVSRTFYQPGEIAQCGLWFPPVDILGYGQAGSPSLISPEAGVRQTARDISSIWALMRIGPQHLASTLQTTSRHIKERHASGKESDLAESAR